MNDSVYMKADLDLRATRARLDRLERGEWFRWAAVGIVTLALALGLVILSQSRLLRDPGRQGQLAAGLRGLLGLVLFFDSFVIYQQVLITRLRRELTSQLALSAAFNLMQRPEPDLEQSPALSTEQRRCVPRPFDQPLQVTTGEEGKFTIEGRIRDVSEQGLGAVIPTSMSPGDVVALEFSTDDCLIGVWAIVRYRRGYHCGLEFVSLTDRDIEALRRTRSQQLGPDADEFRSLWRMFMPAKGADC